MGRNKNSTSNTNFEKAEDNRNIIDTRKNTEETESEQVIIETNEVAENSVTKNSTKAIAVTSVQSSKKEDLFENKNEIKEIKRTRGRPRKTLISIEEQKSFEKSCSENDEDILKFENEVYENDDNIQELNLISDANQTVKNNSTIINFDVEAKICNESIITISSEENSNSNPIVRALQNNITLDRNLSSPDILQVQFNPSLTKTYKNKKKITKTIDNKIGIQKTSLTLQNASVEIIEKTNNSEKGKPNTSKSSQNFEINPNFIRNTRKKVLKYDVCDLLNKKSHKKIQIEARIDSMPAKQKVSNTKFPAIIEKSDNTFASESSLGKLIPNIDDLPVIIRKSAQSYKDLTENDDDKKNFVNILESPDPSKSLIQIQGEIVGQNNSCHKLSNKKLSEDLLQSSKTEDVELIKSNNDLNVLSSADTSVRRRSGRPKTKKDCSKFNSSPTEENQLHSNQIKNNNEEEEPISCAKSVTNEQQSTTENIKLFETKSKNLTKDNIEDSLSAENLKSASLDEIVCNSFNIQEKVEKEKNKQNPTEVNSNISQITKENELESEGIHSCSKFIATKDSENNQNNTKKLQNFDEKSLFKENMLTISNTPKLNETSLLTIKNIKEVRVLIKGLDNIKLRKQERFNATDQENQINLYQKQSSEQNDENYIESVTNDEQKEINVKEDEEKTTIIKQVEVENESIINLNSIETNNFGKDSEQNDSKKISDLKTLENLNQNLMTFPGNINENLELKSEKKVIKTLNSKSNNFVSEKNENIEELDQNTNHQSDVSKKEHSVTIREKNFGLELVNSSKCEANTTECKIENISSSPIKLLTEDQTLVSTKSDKTAAVKSKEFKAGVDIWFEKVNPDSKIKNIEILKRNKIEKTGKIKIKELAESKIKYDDVKERDDFSSNNEVSNKIETKTKEFLFNREDNKVQFYSKFKKDSKEKIEHKSKTLSLKSDSKTKEESKILKEVKETCKQEKKLKERDEKIKIDSKDNKNQTEILSCKQLKIGEKEDLKQKTECKYSNIELVGLNKNETSLKTIDIFNFAAKDEIVQKGQNKKKLKKFETSLTENIQTKQETNNQLLQIENEKELNDKSLYLIADNTSELTEKNLIPNNSEQNDEKDIYKNKFEFITEKNVDEKLVNLESEKIEEIKTDNDLKLQKFNIVNEQNDLNILDSVPQIHKTSIISENLKSNPSNQRISENIELPIPEISAKFSKEEILSEKSSKEQIVENYEIPQNRVDVSLQKTTESINEVLDPLKDIESFLEAAGNLLSRSHSSDDEKESLSRRGASKRSCDHTEEKDTSNEYQNYNEINYEEHNSIVIKDKNNKLESNDFKDNNSEIQNNNQNTDIEKVKQESLLMREVGKNDKKADQDINSKILSEINILSPIKSPQKNTREEWFSKLDSNINKDLSDEMSFEKNKNLNQSTPVPKKIGPGPRTPPLPQSSLEECLVKTNKTENILFEKDNLDREISKSIISTCVKIPISKAASIHELKFMGSPNSQTALLDEQLQLIENQINKKSKKKSEASQKDKELKKFLKTLKKNELSGDWKKTYKELKKIKKKSAGNIAVSKSSLKYSPESEMYPSNEDSLSSLVTQKLNKSAEMIIEYNNNSTIRRSHRLKSMAMQQQNQQNSGGRGGLVRNDYEDLIRADLAQVQAQNTKFLKAMENSLNQFKQIKENEYKCERVISKEAKRMICDCFLTKDEEDRGEYGCGDDCLNRLLMIECGPSCNVNDRCTNKRFQRGQYAPCRVFMTEKKGCGIFAEVEIPAGEFIMEYVGEVVDSDQFEKRAEEYSTCKNKHFYFMSLRSNSIIDATGRGNISRFINHSCDPNAETQKWTVNGELRIGFFTTRTVALGEEITFDYQFQRYGKQAQKCYCEAANCRGWIGEEPDSDEEIEEDNELNFKSKEDLEKISRDIQLISDKEDSGENKIQIIPKTDDTMQNENKSILSDEVLKLKQQEREQRKKDKQRKREIRLAQQKHDFLEDPDLEDEIYRLSKSGLKNQVQTLRLSRLIVRAKLLQTRLNLLEILRAGEIPCRRLFLDYHGLKLLHGWMNESELKDSTTAEDNLKMCFAILETLNCLPIPNRTMLKESKVYHIVQSWAQDKITTVSPKDGSASDSNSGHAVSVKDKPGESVLDSNSKQIQTDIKNLAIKLINDWEVLPEVFRIPRKERVEQMKEHEREADRRYAALHVGDEERNFKTTRDRYKKSRWDSSIKQRWSNKSDNNGKERRKIDQEKLDDGLTKEQRRQAFAAKVAQDEAEKLNAEKRRNLEFEARREFEFKCKFFLLDCTKTHPRDIPFCVDQKTNFWFTLDKRKIPTPPSHMHIKIPTRLKSTNPADYKLPEMDLPQGWKFAIEPNHGRIYYYHVKIRRPQWDPPPKIFPLVDPDNNTKMNSSTSNVIGTVNTNNSSDDSDSDTENYEAEALSSLVQERAISPRKEEDRIYNQNEMRRYKENKEKIRRRKEEIKRRKIRILLKSGELSSSIGEDLNINQLSESDPLPIADYLISSEEDDDIIVEQLDSKLIEKIVKGEGIVDELDALKIKKPLKRHLPIKDKTSVSDITNNSVLSDFRKRAKLDDKKHKFSDDMKKSKSTHKNSKYFARKAKEKFRSDIAGIIVQHLQPYRKDNCQIGKITTNEDFKHLARKLTHFVMIKELKHCDSTGQTLIVTDSVKNKSREFIKKYMAKYGGIYVRPESDPEYKEIPL